MSALLAGLRVVFGRRPGPHVSFHWICCVVYVVTILWLNSRTIASR